MIHFKRLDHILVSIPEQATEEARQFYSQVLGLAEIPGQHPGGAIWFEIADIQLHLREEPSGNRSLRHPAFDIENLDETRHELEKKGVEISYSSAIDGRQRFFIRDPFGNRIEFLAYDA
ncbi:VOC family protein [Fibrella arboris]|uniref:VOC family protein n=1 Tax=Fibrella arboris TaxID=3242486 RepID=UPI00351FDB9D